VRAGVDEWSHLVILTPDGRPPDPDRVAALAALGTMSDALLRLMEPYVYWPPAPNEIEDLETWLELGAAVWNATVEATSGVQLREKLAAIVAEWDLSDEEDPVGLVDEIATRKLRLLADDYRRVARVEVIAERGRATVQAMTTAYLR
jgi:hypothetical protein